MNSRTGPEISQSDAHNVLMTKLFDTLVTGLNEVEAFLAGVTAGYKVTLPSPQPPHPPRSTDPPRWELRRLRD